MVRSGIYMGTHWEMARLWMIYGLDIPEGMNYEPLLTII